MTFRSPIFQLSSEYIDRTAAEDPLFSINERMSRPDQLADYSPEANDLFRARLNEFLTRLEEPAYAPTDDIDRIAALVMKDRWATFIRAIDSGERSRTFSVLWSPVSALRQAFEMMAQESSEEVDHIVRYLALVGSALDTWRRTLVLVASRGHLPSRRHVVGVGEQALTYADGGFNELVARLEAAFGARDDLRKAAAVAQEAFGAIGRELLDVYAPQTTASDYVGAERYALWAHSYTGRTIDYKELYAWGWEDLKRINARMREIGAVVAPEATTLKEIAGSLDKNPKYLIHGTDELLRVLKKLTADATDALDGVHFDIDPSIRFCDVRLAPAGSASAAYYYGPSEDLSRPGTTWFPTMGADTFEIWRHVSTWYHEGIPGHHLESAGSLVNADRQSRFHRIAGWMSGYGEGWALYAERLMDELGFLSDPGNEMGYLVGQALRAARIVVDIGMHLQLAAPSDLGELPGLGDCSNKVWTPEMAVGLLEGRALMNSVESRSEVERYLGNPGQAISYKVGERCWLEAREAARGRHGASFDLKAFHRYGLDLGPMGLDLFLAEMERF